jgi:putative ABC transport system substrate-binding protein
VAPGHSSLPRRYGSACSGSVRRWAEGRAERLPGLAAELAALQPDIIFALGGDVAPAARRAASYVDRIARGARPEELPVERPTRIELVINQRTADALGLSIPSSVLLRADRVIR